MANQVLDLVVFPTVELRAVYAFAGFWQFLEGKKQPLVGLVVGFVASVPGLLLFTIAHALQGDEDLYEGAFLSRKERLSYASLSLIFITIMLVLEEL